MAVQYVAQRHLAVHQIRLVQDQRIGEFHLLDQQADQHAAIALAGDLTAPGQRVPARVVPQEGGHIGA